MTLYDLLFILLFLTAVASLAFAAATALRGNGPRAGSIVKRVVLGAVVYLGVVWGVAFRSPGRILALGEDLCADDWCIAVTSVQPVSHDTVHGYEVIFRVSSRARAVNQRERGVEAFVRDAHGQRYAGVRGPADSEFAVLLGPGAAVLTHRRYTLPADAMARDVIITRVGVPFPSCCIIGDATDLLRPPMVRIPEQR